MWRTGDGEASFQTFAGEDRLVLDGGRCVYSWDTTYGADRTSRIESGPSS